MDLNSEFLFRLPGWRHLLSLSELETEIDNIIIERVGKDFAEMDSVMLDFADSMRDNIVQSMKVEIYDTKVMKKTDKAPVTLGKMPISTVIKKFQ